MESKKLSRYMLPVVILRVSLSCRAISKLARKARIYSPTLGRFLQTDPIGYEDGLNWYDYVGGDPVNGRDPSGLSCSNGGYCDPLNPEDDGPPINVRAHEAISGGGGGGIITISPGGLGVPVELFGGGGGGGMMGEEAEPEMPQCPLATPTGNYRIGPNTDPRFTPELASILSKAFAELNAKGITPYITSGFRTKGDQARMRGGASGSNPAARVSNHQLGLSVDLNTRTADFPTIRGTLTGGGLTWGGKWRAADPPHFQLPPGGTRADPAQAAICEAENG